MAQADERGMIDIGVGGPLIKKAITDAKIDRKVEPFDPGASMLGTDNEAGAPTDPDEMAIARNAPKPHEVA